MAGRMSFRRTLPPNELCSPSRKVVSITRIFLGDTAAIIARSQFASPWRLDAEQTPQRRWLPQRRDRLAPAHVSPSPGGPPSSPRRSPRLPRRQDRVRTGPWPSETPNRHRQSPLADNVALAL